MAFIDKKNEFGKWCSERLCIHEVSILIATLLCHAAYLEYTSSSVECIDGGIRGLHQTACLYPVEESVLQKLAEWACSLPKLRTSRSLPKMRSPVTAHVT